MNKLIGFMLAALALSAGVPAFAGWGRRWPSRFRLAAQPDYGPAPGTPEYYGNSGFTPSPWPGYYYNGRTYAYPPQAGPAYPYGDGDRRIRQRDRDEAVRNAARRDRDGDGVRNNRDRYPNDPSRY